MPTIVRFGGGTEARPKVYVQESAPTSAKQGDFWIIGSNYKIDYVDFRASAPESYQENTLFVRTYRGGVPGKYIDLGRIGLTCEVLYAQPYVNGWLEAPAHVFLDGGWVDISKGSTEVFALGYEYRASSNVYVYQADLSQTPITYAKKKNYLDPIPRLTGMKTRIFGVVSKEQTIIEVDPYTFDTINSASVDFDCIDIFATAYRLFVWSSYTSSGANETIMTVKEIDPNTLSEIATHTFIWPYSYTSSLQWRGIGCCGDKMYFGYGSRKTSGSQTLTFNVYSINNWERVDKKSVYIPVTPCRICSLDGTADKLFALYSANTGEGDNFIWYQVIDPETFQAVEDGDVAPDEMIEGFTICCLKGG